MSRGICGYCKTYVKKRVQLSDDKVCEECWDKFLIEHEEEVAMAKEQPIQMPPISSVLTCHKCGKKQDVYHYCYGHNLEPNPHYMDENPTCHLCWDDNLRSAVESAGY